MIERQKRSIIFVKASHLYFFSLHWERINLLLYFLHGFLSFQLKLDKANLDWYKCLQENLQNFKLNDKVI